MRFCVDVPGVICVPLIVAVAVIFMCFVLNVRGHTHCSEVVHFSTLCARFPPCWPVTLSLVYAIGFHRNCMFCYCCLFLCLFVVRGFAEVLVFADHVCLFVCVLF